MFFNPRILLASVLLSQTIAAPHDNIFVGDVLDELAKRQTFTPQALSSPQQNFYTPFAHLASAAYCRQTLVKAWNCGGDCASAPGFQVRKVGGNNLDTAPYFVGYDPRDLVNAGDGKGTVVVSHQGTPNITTSLLPQQLLNVTQYALSTSPFFTNPPSGASSHGGFLKLHSATAQDIFNAVMSTMTEFKTQKVVVTGHSLGAALALLSAVQLQQKLPSGSNVTSIAFASPRVGSPALATFAGNQIKVIRHVNNRDDFVPVIPGRSPSDFALTAFNLLEIVSGAYAPFLQGRYAGQKGEVHIDTSGTWYDCGPVSDNPSTLCSTGAVTNVDSEVIMSLSMGRLIPRSHTGPYNGVLMSEACTQINAVPAN